MSRQKITIRLADTVVERLDTIAKATGLNRNELIRVAITEYLEKAEASIKRNKELRKLVETLNSLETEDLIDIYSEITKELHRRGIA